METVDLTKDVVLKRDIPWETYKLNKLIDSTCLMFIRRYDHKSLDAKAQLLSEDGPSYVRTFLVVLKNVTTEETVEYTLALLDEMLTADAARAKLFHDPSLAVEDIYGSLVRLLSKKNWFVLEKTTRVLTRVLSARPSTSGAPGTASGPENVEQVIATFVEWLVAQLKHPAHPTRGVPTAVNALSTLLREPQARVVFCKADGVRLLAPLITPASAQQHMQLLYESILCVWLLSFHETGIEAVSSTRVLPRLIDVAKATTSKEKIVRVSVLTLRNLAAGKASFGAEMVELGLPKVVTLLKLQNWTDEDLTVGLDALEEALKGSIQTQSSFFKYRTEVMSGQLDWTPMHKNQAFWRENFQAFEDSDFQILRVLVTLAETSQDPKTLAVACYDLGQFVDNHPAGRGILKDLKAKDRIMKLLEHPEPEVRKQALITVQKLLLSAKYVSYMQ